MLKKILIAAGALAGLILVIIVAAGIVIMLVVDKAFVELKLSQALNRQVRIEKIGVNIFSVVSGIEISKMTVSNFKTPLELATLQDKPVAANDVFAGLEALRFKIRILPLLQKQFELDELVLHRPVINLTRSKQGVLNIEDLIVAPKKPEKDQRATTKKQDGTAPEQARSLTADNLPVAVAVREIGIKDGTINYYDDAFDQKIQIYRLTALGYDINVDSRDLANKDEVKLKVMLGIKTVGQLHTGSVQGFDITFDAAGKMIPFDIKTRQLDPEIMLHAAVPDGQLSGLQIFNAVAALPLLGDYLGEHISFLKGKQEWKNSKTSFVDLRYKAGKAEISNGNLDLREAKLLFAGTVDTDSKALDATLDVVLKKEINASVKDALAKKIAAGIKKPAVKKYVAVDKLAETALQPLFNKDGFIAVKVKAGGTTAQTDMKIVAPQLDSVAGIVKKAAGDVLLEAGRAAGEKILEEEKNKLLDNTLNLLKKK